MISSYPLLPDLQLSLLLLVGVVPADSPEDAGGGGRGGGLSDPDSEQCDPVHLIHIINENCALLMEGGSTFNCVKKRNIHV